MPSLFKKPKLRFTDRLPEPGHFGADAVLIYDRILGRQIKGFTEWAERFPVSYGVKGGEELKSLDAFPRHMANLLAETERLSPKNIVIVVVGGGSVGDFGGFAASILKRGVRFVQIPSTWLAAIDSAHGGKNALNISGVKNQIGTFHFPEEIHLVRSVLFSEDAERALDAYGELAKMALIDGGRWSRAIAGSQDVEGHLIWSCLPNAIQAKYRVVAKDPFEKKKIRQVLNLGHTVGHALEAYHGLSHGAAVAQGLLFSMEWSRRKNLLKDPAYARVRSFLNERFFFQPLPQLKGFKKIPQKDFLHLIRNDKKRISTSLITEVFIQDFGKTRLLNVPLNSLAEEAKLQGWVE